jgi:hypothetical protein
MIQFQMKIGEQFLLGNKAIGEAQDYTILSLLSVIVRNIYVLAGVILLIMLFVGGIGMMLNAGNPEKQKQSSKALSSAAIGFAILVAGYWLIKIIEIIFGLQIFAPVF